MTTPLWQLQCCFLDVAQERILTAPDSYLLPDVDFAYPSTAGQSPPCIDRSFLTVHLDPARGITRAIPRGVERAQTDVRCAMKKSAVICVTFGIPCTADMKTPLDWTKCSEVLGTCDDYQRPGTFTYDMWRSDNALEILSNLGGGVKSCYCSKAAEPAVAGDPVVKLNCDKPIFNAGNIHIGGPRLLVTAKYEVLF